MKLETRFVAVLMTGVAVTFALADNANAQRRGAAIASGLAAGVILGAIAAGAASQRAYAQPRSTGTRTVNRSRSRSTGAASSDGGQRGGAIPASSADPFAGVAASRRVSE